MRKIRRFIQIAVVLTVVVVAGVKFRDHESLEKAPDMLKDGIETVTGKKPLEIGKKLERELKSSRLQRALKDFEKSQGRSIEAIEELIDEGLVDRADLVDEWGRSLQVEANAEGVRLRGAGPDGKFNTKDDWTVGG